MDMLKKHTAILALTTLLLNGSFALADAPTSQFGFSDWPYRYESSCAASTSLPTETTVEVVTSTPAAQKTTLSGANGNSGVSSTTCAPTAAPTATPRPTSAPGVSTPAPTQKPESKPTQAPSMDEDYTTEQVRAQEQNAWNLMNSDRAANGLSALPLDAELSAIARKKSEDMRDKGYFSHTSPTYGSVSDMLKTFGYSFSAAGENIAHHATVAKAHAAFMSSSGHKRNILSSSWTKVGIGVCYDANGYVYVTQIFAR